MTLLACQIFSTSAHAGSFARTAEQLHLTPSAISHAVSTMEAECGFPLFTRTKSGVTMTAAAENLLPAIQRLLASSESLDQSIAQINGMHKGVLRLGVFNSACVTWLPQLVPQFQLDFPGIDVQIYQGSYADICAWVKNGTAEIGFLSNSSALDLDFEPLYDDELVCIAPASYRPARPGCVSAEELRGQPFVSQLADVDADIQSYFKTNDLRVDSRCYIVDDQSMIAMVACGRGFAIMPELMFKTGTDPHGCQVLRLEPAATRSIGLACLGLAQLERLEGFVETKKARYDQYKAALDGVHGLRILPFKEESDGVRSNHWFYSLYLKDSGLDRDTVIAKLQEQGIQTRPVWALINEQADYPKNEAYALEKAQDYRKYIVNLPCSTNLTEQDCERVIAAVKNL